MGLSCATPRSSNSSPKPDGHEVTDLVQSPNDILRPEGMRRTTRLRRPAQFCRMNKHAVAREDDMKTLFTLTGAFALTTLMRSTAFAAPSGTVAFLLPDQAPSGS